MTEEADRSPGGTPTFDTLAVRAQNSGYRLIREQGATIGWALLDGDDGEHLHTATSLTEIARYLDE